MQRAIYDGKTRLKVEINIPELNPEMDVYRIGTLMELVRVIALSFADDGKRVKVCVQGSMGEGALAGMPLQLAGSRKMLEFMDWGDHIASGTFVKIGSIVVVVIILAGSKYIDSKESKYTWCGTSKNLPKTCAKKVDEQDDIFTLVAPEKAVGYCDDLRGMTESAGNASGHPHQS
ncbi:adenylate kinase 5, chloroplastic-like [Eucalyptus grandis]|uniref:adenylate kinase 5, chloroplastic-like n=1 Tax=Eucalyptus grandis TaxID=71139 RepID=UPI00192E7E1F|nr:adenylate kinase 5, chloroplastic-like [Eucalyptus grandis]